MLRHEGLFIDQKRNFRADFGEVLRSSAIFYYRQAPGFKTTLSFMNYWKLKRQLEVNIVATWRDMSGKLIRREPMSFDAGMVLQLEPDGSTDPREGSVEIEAFSSQNMVVPYSAVMAIYETPLGITSVHSYARAYSRDEVEEGRTICLGEEGGWTLRDNERSRSFAVFHNGPASVPPQDITLRILNRKNECRTQVIPLPALQPYESVKLYPQEHIGDLIAFLDGHHGHATLSFRLGEGFTRMLVGIEARDGSDCQVTHSNFNWSRHLTDRLDDPHSEGYMVIPSLTGTSKEVRILVYPEMDAGTYLVRDSSGPIASYSQGVWNTLSYRGGTLRFSKETGHLPSRIVTAMTGQNSRERLPFETSLGIETRNRPPKSLWWGTCARHSGVRSRIVAHDSPHLFGGLPVTETIHVNLYSASSRETLTATLSASDLPALESGIILEDLFPAAQEFLCGQYGYFTAFCRYGGLSFYSVLENQHESLTFEHAF